ncbi:hypothetical protein Egran_05807 [Elaphomyces granulatus]|uniref:Uncharacterized protein n=1 Tax=Elaphomyces granulatus TaxID=519963 RepID=A0A232LQI3_9EURO|nr:hypothetical protein Egran_05807 [Elaphomyces granulatus]
MEPTQKPKSSLHAKGESPGKRARFGRFIRRVMGKKDSEQTGSPGSSQSIDRRPTPPESAHDRQDLPEVPLDNNKSEAGEKPIQSDSSAVENPFSHAQDDLDQRYSFLKYSAINWVLHYKLRQDQVERHSLQLAKALLDTPGQQRDIWSSIHFRSTNHAARIHQNWAGLILASFLGLTDVVDDILIQNGSDINAGGARFYDNALQAASVEGHRETVELLLSKNANVNAQGGAFGNALQAASRNGHREVVELLLSKNANVNAQGGVFGNALQAASFAGHREVDTLEMHCKQHLAMVIER